MSYVKCCRDLLLRFEEVLITLEALIYLIPPKILLLSLLLQSILNGGSEIAANFLPTNVHTYLFQSSMTLFLKSPEYLVDVLSLLLVLLAIAGGLSRLTCGSESADNLRIGDYHLSFYSELPFFLADTN